MQKTKKGISIREDKNMRYKEGLVSCVTPVHNGEKYLRSMLDSVLNQTYPFVELFLVDDGSTDGTLEIARSYQERFAKKNYRYQVIETVHKHASAAINQGLAQVTGEFLIWPDSDDILEPDSVERRVEFLKSHPEYRCVRSLMYYFDQNEEKRKTGEPLGDLKEERLFFEILEFQTFVCCGCYMLRTKEFFEIYPKHRIPEYPVGQNFQMLLPFMYRHRCPTIPEKLYGVRVHPDSHSRMPRTQEEEEQRYRDFEDLVEEIRKISRIRNIRERIRIVCWKQKRRREIAYRYGKKWEEKKASFVLFLCGKSSKQQALLHWIKKQTGREECKPKSE